MNNLLRGARRALLGLWALLTEAWAEFRADDCERLGAALAYRSLFSVTPLLLVATAVAGLLFEAEEARLALEGYLGDVVGAEGGHVIVEMLGRALPRSGGIVSSVVGVVGVVFGAGSMFVELRAALNRVWDVPARHNPLLSMFYERMVGFAMVLGVGFLLLGTLVASTVLRALEAALAGAPPFALDLLGRAYPLGSFVLTAVAFAALFRAVPDRSLSWRDVAVGSVVTAALFSLGRAAISLYLAHSGVTTAYGAAGSFVAMLVWVYYSAQILLFGAEVTQVYSRRAGTQRRDAKLLDERPAEVTDPPGPPG